MLKRLTMLRVTSQEWLNFIQQNPAFFGKLEANNTKIWETIFQIQPISSTAQINGYEAQTKIDELRYGDGQATQKIYAGNANLSDFTEKKILLRYCIIYIPIIPFFLPMHVNSY